MGRYFPFAIKVDGRRYTGDWSLTLGGQLCIRSAWGSETMSLGHEKPETLAAVSLERIVGAYHQNRAAEEARQAQDAARLGDEAPARRERIKAQVRGDPDPIREALRDLLEQLESSGFRDKNGHPLETNEAFIEIKALMTGYGAD